MVVVTFSRGISASRSQNKSAHRRASGSSAIRGQHASSFEEANQVALLKGDAAEAEVQLQGVKEFLAGWFREHHLPFLGFRGFRFGLASAVASFMSFAVINSSTLTPRARARR